MNHEIVIVAATRTAIGSFGGSLSSIPAHKLGSAVISSLLQKTGLDSNQVDEVILGQVLTAGSGQNPARQASIDAGLPEITPAMTINKVCGSGLKAVQLAFQAVACGDAEIVIAGGQENMSLSGHVLPRSREGKNMGPWEMVDTLVVDGLWCAFNDYHMGITAENIAEKHGINREEQDKFAVVSQNRSENAIKEGRFKDEIVPVTVKGRKEDVVINQDEFPRAGVTVEGLSKLKPAFKKDGTVTAGNASGLNDGAAAVILMRLSEAKKRNLVPLAVISSWASVGVDPAMMGTGPIPSSRKALEKSGWEVDDLDLIESNEAFAAQACCVLNEMNFDPEKVNVNGGAIALGHPIGASGCRILVTLLHEMKRREVKKGLATLCIGGGMGIAMCVNRDY